jgi:hypothetical protein
MGAVIPPHVLATLNPVAAAIPPLPLDLPAFVDTECYRNYWLLKIRPQGGGVITFRLLEGESFSPLQVEQIRRVLDTYCCVTFYGKGYDRWTISRALTGATPAQIREVNDALIVHKIKGWELGLGEWDLRNHIDVCEVAPGKGSQKVYAGRIHAKTMRDLPYPPDTWLTPEQIAVVDNYCENDLDVLEHLFNELKPMIDLRVNLGERYGMDLRSKSDAQVAEAVIKARCEQALGHRIWKPNQPDLSPLRYRKPDFITFASPELQHALSLIVNATFYLDGFGNVITPPELEKLVIHLGRGNYAVGIGGLHSQEKSISHVPIEGVVYRDIDVESYYPSMMINTGEYPPALGPQFRAEFVGIKTERLEAKHAQAQFEKNQITQGVEYMVAKTMNAGGKIMINGTFGKTGSIHSILFAPSMLLQTTLTGQLCLLMLIEWHEMYGIPIISANTDGIVMACPTHLLETSRALVVEWERRTNLKMEETIYRSVHSRDVNNYFAIKTDGKVKRKGEYAPASLTDKKNPDVEICSDAVAAFLAKGTPIDWTITTCRDIRKFVTMQECAGGAFKLWGEAPLGDEKGPAKTARLIEHGWTQEKRGRWTHPAHSDPLLGTQYGTTEAFELTFPVPRPEFMGKVIRWYYGVNAPGHIVYGGRKARVGLSYGAKPCMTLPDQFPTDIDYGWYMRKAASILEDIGYRG